MTVGVEFDAANHASRICSEKGWTLGKLLGSGGSAAVFDVTTASGVAALKIFFPRFIEGKEGIVTRKRLDIVKGTIIGHDCPTLVQVYAVEDFEDSPFMLMERVSGKMLTDVLQLVPTSAFMRIVEQVARAAKFLEDKGLTHRDIKSDNIMVDDAFERATLVDVGVVRLLEDVVGSGTDDDGQLPFVATARYSSPEYMFRLMPPGPELWRALNFYQMGGLIHDLVAGEPLFEQVVRQAAGNRYLIAHAVATEVPRIPARADVPDFLVSLGERCLLKDARARLASVSWEDFLGRDRQRENEALLGMLGEQQKSAGNILVDVSELGRLVEVAIDERLTAKKLSCRHSSEVTGKTSVAITIHWTPPSLARPINQRVRLHLECRDDQVLVSTEGALDQSSEAMLRLPTVAVAFKGSSDGGNVANQAYDLFLETSVQLMKISGDGNRGAAI